LVFTSIGLGHVFCFFWPFIALDPGASSSFAASSGFAVITALALIIEQTPVFILLYIAAALILKKTFQERKSIMGNILLLLAVAADIWRYLSWSEGAGDDTGGLLWTFAPPVLIGIGMVLFLTLPSFFPDEKSPEIEN
jgi:hypothetical protein